MSIYFRITMPRFIRLKLWKISHHIPDLNPIESLWDVLGDFTLPIPKKISNSIISLDHLSSSNIDFFHCGIVWTTVCNITTFPQGLLLFFGQDLVSTMEELNLSVKTFNRVNISGGQCIHENDSSCSLNHYFTIWVRQNNDPVLDFFWTGSVSLSVLTQCNIKYQ